MTDGGEGDFDELREYRELVAEFDEEMLQGELVRRRYELAKYDEVYAELREAAQAGDDELARLHGLATTKLRLAEGALVMLRQRLERAEELEAHEASFAGEDEGEKTPGAGGEP